MKIYKISTPGINEKEIIAFLKDEDLFWRRTENTSGANETVELAGRLCYMSFGDLQSNRNNSEYIENLIDMGHESVLEHVNWSFIITGVSRGFTHQLVRHRVGFAFSQLSQQYFNSSMTCMVEPNIIMKHGFLSEKWRQITDKSKEAYTELLALLDQLENENTTLSAAEKKEIKRLKYSAARSVVPNATDTKIFVTANARAIRHFLDVRGSIPGDEEMRTVSAEILRLVSEDSAVLFSDFYISYLSDNSPIVLKKIRGKQ